MVKRDPDLIGSLNESRRKAELVSDNLPNLGESGYELVVKVNVESNMELGAWLKQERIRADLTQAALANKLGTTQSHVSLVENGVKSCSLRYLVEFAKAIDRKLCISIE